MLKSHIDAKENALVVISQVPANSGHTLHKGTPREAFIKEFLETHLSSNVAVGTGEIIDSNSRPGQQRNQYDIVLYKRSYPKIDFGGGISGFLIESVIATIEVKSTLDQKEFGNAAKAAHAAKQLIPNVVTSFSTGYIPPKIINIIVAYDGPANMKTVYGWIATEYQKHGIPISNLPQNENQRIYTAADSIDAVFVLKKGFIYFDNVPTGFASPQLRQQNPRLNWIYADSSDGNLLLLFLILQGAMANIEGKWLNAIPYLSKFKVSNLQWGT